MLSGDTNNRRHLLQLSDLKTHFFTFEGKAWSVDGVSLYLEKVGLSPEQDRRYPYEYNGDQRQRIGITQVLALNPKLIIGEASLGLGCLHPGIDN